MLLEQGKKSCEIHAGRTADRGLARTDCATRLPAKTHGLISSEPAENEESPEQTARGFLSLSLILYITGCDARNQNIAGCDIHSPAFKSVGRRPASAMDQVWHNPLQLSNTPC